MQLIDPAHERKISIANRLPQVVHRSSADTQKLGLARDG